jgi:hypothetical protein
VWRSALEMIVSAQEREIVPNAQLGQQRVDRADPDTCSATRVSEVGRCDVVLAHEFDDPLLLAAGNELLQCFCDDSHLRSLPADLNGSIKKNGIYRKVGGHV